MSPIKARCLILACGNTLREDDGVGPWLAAWAEERFQGEESIRTICRQQWTPDLAEEIAAAESVLFVDCSTESAAGSVQVFPVKPSADHGKGTHHFDAAQLLALSRDFLDASPQAAFFLTVGAGSLELGEGFSPAVKAVLPEACRLLEETVRSLLG